MENQNWTTGTIQPKKALSLPEEINEEGMAFSVADVLPLHKNHLFEIMMMRLSTPLIARVVDFILLVWKKWEIGFHLSAQSTNIPILVMPQNSAQDLFHQLDDLEGAEIR